MSEPSQRPVASIVIPSFRGAERLPLLLDALADQQQGTPEFEVIVVIDGVDDGSVALLARERRLTLRTIQCPENRGRLAALNAGFEAAWGQVLIRCDDDLVPRPDYVAGHVTRHEGALCGVVGLYLNVYESSRYSEVYGYDADERFRRDAYAGNPTLGWRYGAGNCSVTRETWQRIGGYDPRYQLYGWEDIDFGYRLFLAGIPVVLLAELETPHRVAAVTTHIRAKRAAHSAAARRLFEAKFDDHPLPPAVPPWSAWNALVRGMAITLRRNPARAGHLADRVIPALPRPLAKKIVALVVESAAVAGYRYPHLAIERF